VLEQEGLGGLQQPPHGGRGRRQVGGQNVLMELGAARLQRGGKSDAEAAANVAEVACGAVIGEACGWPWGVL